MGCMQSIPFEELLLNHILIYISKKLEIEEHVKHSISDRKYCSVISKVAKNEEEIAMLGRHWESTMITLRDPIISKPLPSPFFPINSCCKVQTQMIRFLVASWLQKFVITLITLILHLMFCCLVHIGSGFNTIGHK